jgi:MFS family permease
VVLSCSLIGPYVGGAVYFGFTAFSEPISRTFGWSHTQVAFAVSLQGLENGIFAPFVGFLVDRFGPKRIIIGGVMIVGLGMILLSGTQTLIMFYTAFALVSFGAGGCTAVVTTTAWPTGFIKRLDWPWG